MMIGRMTDVITGTQSQRAIEVLRIRETNSSRLYTWNNKYSEQGATKVLRRRGIPGCTPRIVISIQSTEHQKYHRSKRRVIPEMDPGIILLLDP